MAFSLEKIKSVHHPLISAMYMKKDMCSGPMTKDVLVIETSFSDEDDDYEFFDSYLTDLLLDLEELKSQVETQVGKFDRVDIRTSQ